MENAADNANLPSISGDAEITSIENFRLNTVALRESIAFVRKNDPRFQDSSLGSMAAAARISESTFKKLLNGDITNPRANTLWSIGFTFGIDIRIPMGLAPTRDFRKEQEAYDPTLMGEMRRQVDALEQSNACKDSELDRLRKLVLEKGESLGHAEEKVSALARTIADRERTISNLENMRRDDKRVAGHCKFIIIVETMLIITALTTAVCMLVF